MPIYTLARFRILFGLLLCFAIISSIAKNEIPLRYTEPTLFFKYYGFSWLGYIGDQYIWPLHILLIISSLCIAAGLFYRLNILVFSLGFAYLHLLDSTNYINHYYLVSLLLGIMLFAPAHRAWSLDVWRGGPQQTEIPSFWYRVLQAQVGLVYFFAGIAKLNPDWLDSAMPVRIWLLQSADVYPSFGPLLAAPWLAWLVAWGAAFYDLTIWAWLLWSRSRPYAYVVVLCFHFITGMLFDIGLFPWLMPAATTLFFVEEARPIAVPKSWKYIATTYFVVQFALPLRSHFLYEGNILWHEEGYRWSWRVMLVEKEGMATFTVSDSLSGQSEIIDNRQFLTPFQEKRLIQPEHILQFAHFLAEHYQKHKGWRPIVKADVRVVLNARRSAPLVDTSVNLATQTWSMTQKTWLLPSPN